MDGAGRERTEVSSQQLAAGDVVKVELEVAVLREMQQNHGGWNDTMANVYIHLHITEIYVAMCTQNFYTYFFGNLSMCSLICILAINSDA